MTDDNKPCLIITTEGQPDKVVQVDDLLIIGRSSSCHVVLDDHEASRNHAEIRQVAGRYRLSDLGSANGTWVNGRRLTVPRELEDGDQIQIGRVKFRYQSAATSPEYDQSMAPSTQFQMRTEHVVVLVADIRNYTTMSEALPTAEFSQIVSAWFREGSDIIEQHGGMIDKFIGDAIMAFWITRSKSDCAKEIDAALQSARELIDRASVFSERLSAKFPGYTFRIGVGLNSGDAILGNVGTGENQSFTIVGDSVNVAFRMEALTKEKNVPVIVGQGIVDCAASHYEFSDLGTAHVKGRKEPVSISALERRSEG